MPEARVVDHGEVEEPHPEFDAAGLEVSQGILRGPYFQPHFQFSGGMFVILDENLKMALYAFKRERHFVERETSGGGFQKIEVDDPIELRSRTFEHQHLFSRDF